jgi:hypothetical protein
LYAAGEGKPMPLAQGKTGADGSFRLDIGADKLQSAADKVLYVVARGGTPKAEGAKGPNNAIALLAVLGPKLPKAITVNEFTPRPTRPAALYLRDTSWRLPQLPPRRPRKRRSPPAFRPGDARSSTAKSLGTRAGFSALAKARSPHHQGGEPGGARHRASKLLSRGPVQRGKACCRIELNVEQEGSEFRVP